MGGRDVERLPGVPGGPAGLTGGEMEPEVESVINRLRRVEGQVRGLQKMIQEGKDCGAILTQLSAAKSALDKVGMFLISHRMRECIEETSGIKLDEETLEQAFQVFMKYAQYPMVSVYSVEEVDES